MATKSTKNKSGPVINIPTIETPEDLFSDSKDDCIVPLPKKRVAKYYLTNADLLPAVLESKKVGRMTDKLARMLMLLTDRYSRKANFNGYSFREDMVSAALINLCQNALKFNPEKSSNPFAFYTTAIKNSFLQYMLDEKKQRYIRDQLLVEAGQDASHSFMSSNKNSDDHSYSSPSNEARVAESNPYKKKIDEAKAKKSKRQEEKEQKEKVVKALLVF